MMFGNKKWPLKTLSAFYFFCAAKTHDLEQVVYAHFASGALLGATSKLPTIARPARTPNVQFNST
jgi:hypothetical protein